MTRLAALALLMLGCSCATVAARPSVLRMGFMHPVLRDSILSAEWPTAPGSSERAYCVAAYRVKVLTPGRGQVDSIFLVDQVRLAHTEWATPAAVKFACYPGEPHIHTHPPHSCTNWSDASTCTDGGVYARQCQPTRNDYRFLAHSRAPFGVIQCGPREHRFYFLADYRT